MSYFHTGTRTIIGAESFHCPVRDGKEWDQLAMVIRLNCSPACVLWFEAQAGLIRRVEIISALSDIESGFDLDHVAAPIDLANG